MFTIEDSPATEAPQCIEAKLAEAVEAVGTAKINYGQAALDGEEGKVSAAVVNAADKALHAAKRRVSDLTAASAAASARAERQVAIDAAAVAVAAAAAKKESLEAIRVAAQSWDAAVEQLRVITTEFEQASDAFRKHAPTPAENLQMEATRAHALPIIEHALQHYLGEPKLLPFLRGNLLRLETHIPKAG